MRRLIILSAMLMASVACHKDSPGRKIVDGLPVSNNQVSIEPARATQQYLLLKNSALNLTITNLNRLNQSLPALGLTGPDGSHNYTGHVSESHYGVATLTIQFQDASHAPLEPFTTLLTSASIQFVHIFVNCNSNPFTISEDLTLSLDIVGGLPGPYHMTGTSSFTDPSYSINYALDPAGIQATISGLIGGRASAASTISSPKTTSSSLAFGNESDISGTMRWDDQTSGIQVSINGSGYITTNDSRILFQ